MRINFASIQLNLTDNVEINYIKTKNLIERVRNNSVILLPEMFFCGFNYDRLEEFSALSEYMVEGLRVLSEEKKSLICGTVPQRGEEGYRNTAVLLLDGEIVGMRAKKRLFSPFDEDKYFVPGEEDFIFETRFGRVGVLICFELRFTDMVLELKRRKVDILLVPAQWGYARREHLRILSRARAIELQSYVVVADTWGDIYGQKFAGCSGIYSPWGEVLSFSEQGDVLLQAEGETEILEKVRKTIPVHL